MAAFTVDRLEPHEHAPVIAALARAFFDDPLFGFFVPNLVRQQKALIAFMNAGVKDAAPFGECWVAHADGKVACAAVWLPPGVVPAWDPARPADLRAHRCRPSRTAASGSAGRSHC